MGKTLSDCLREDVNRTFLNADHFAENVIQYPRGNRQSPVMLLGILEEKESRRDVSAGEGIAQYASLSIDGSVATAGDDEWVAGQALWQTNSIGPDIAGMRTVELRRDIKLQTNRGRGTL